MPVPVTFAAFYVLPLPAQVQVVAAHGRRLATRYEGGLRQSLYDVCGFFVETWSWATDPDDAILLLFSFTRFDQLDGWLAALDVPRP